MPPIVLALIDGVASKPKLTLSMATLPKNLDWKRVYGCMLWSVYVLLVGKPYCLAYIDIADGSMGHISRKIQTSKMYTGIVCNKITEYMRCSDFTKVIRELDSPLVVVKRGCVERIAAMLSFR